MTAVTQLLCRSRAGDTHARLCSDGGRLGRLIPPLPLTVEGDCKVFSIKVSSSPALHRALSPGESFSSTGSIDV